MTAIVRALLWAGRAAGVPLAVAAGAANAQKAAPQAVPPLAPFSAQRIVVLPVQLLRADTGVFVTAATWETFRRQLDDSVGAAIASRGIGRGWSYAADVARSAKRNAPYVGDPYALGVQLLRGAKIRPGEEMPELIASNLRSVIALGDARYALIPVEFRIIRRGAEELGVLQLILVDGRAAIFVWAGEVAGDPAPALTPAFIGSLAQRVADLVIAR